MTFIRKVLIIPIAVLTITASLLSSGCNLPGLGDGPKQEGNSKQPTSNAEAQDQTKDQATDPQAELKEPVPNPLTGITVEKANLERRPLAVMVENSPMARPQSGLAKADLIYEALAEGGITRFMAIFYGGDAEEVGPVRSARPYYLARAMEYDALYVHSGGSPEALAQLKAPGVPHLNQFYNNTPFWRSKQRKAPHNLYGDTLKMRKVAQQKYPGWKGNIPVFEFLDKDQVNPDGQPAKTLTINYANKASQVKYEYNDGEHKYYRFTAGKAHQDAVTAKQLTADNIILQFTGTKVIDGEGRRKVSMVGTGTGYLFSGGQRYRLKWAKDNLRSATRYSLAGGGKLRLNPGQTWIQVVPPGTKLNET
ncbi:MAG: DUF3048 domain-containing protein [Carboxydocellales bacterium]